MTFQYLYKYNVSLLFGFNFFYLKALKRLHQLEVLGCILKTEYANETCERLANSLESRFVVFLISPGLVDHITYLFFVFHWSC